MNLNFYSPHNAGSLENLQTALQDQITKLNQIRNMDLSQAQVQQPLQPQRYYLDCGCKEDWEEFLKINYNITEDQIFEDYRLFLQAKAELHEDRNKEKLQSMKDKIASPKTLDKGKMETQPQVIPQQNVHQNLPINQQVSIQNMEQVNASNIPTNFNQNINANNGRQLEKNTNNNENKGVKHVR